MAAVEAQQKVSLPRLIALASCAAGANFGYTAAFVQVTPLFITLGLSSFWSTVPWYAGPLSGLIFNPIACAWSDHCHSRWGRRRPFMVVGILMAVLGMGLAANPVVLGNLISRTHGQNVAIAITIFALWILMIGLNVAQGPGWAAVLDKCSYEQQTLAASVVSILSMIVNIVSTLIQFVDLVAIFPFFSSNGQAVFCIAGVFTFLSLLPTLIAADEAPLKRKPQQKGINNDEPPQDGFFKQTYTAMTLTSSITFRILFLFFLSSAVVTPWQFQFTNYMGLDVYHGDPNGNASAVAAYNLGVREGSLGFAIAAAVGLGFALICTKLVDWIGAKPIYLIIHFISASTVLVVLPQIRTAVASLALFSVMGFLNSFLLAVPYALIGMAVPKAQVGLFLGLLNAVQVVAQLITNFASGIAMSTFGTVTSALALGGICSGVAFFASFLLIVPKKQNDEKEPLLVVEAHA